MQKECDSIISENAIRLHAYTSPNGTEIEN